MNKKNFVTSSVNIIDITKSVYLKNISILASPK